MRIAEIVIDGFGIWRDLRLADIPPGITVLEGANEAGKTTLMAFIRAILFGFEDRRTGRNRYEPLRGGQHGGSLVLVDSSAGAWRVERLEGGARGRVILYRPDDTRGDETALQALLRGTTRVLFQNVFAFGLDELQRLDTLQAEEVSGHIYAAGMGATGVSPVKIRHDLELEAGVIYRPRAHASRANVLLRALEDGEQRLRTLQQAPAEYDQLHQQRGQLLARLGDAERELRAARDRERWIQTLCDAWPSWARLVEVREALAGMPPIDSFPEGGSERLQQFDARIGAITDLIQNKRREIGILRARADGLEIDPQLLEQAATIRALEDDRGAFLEALRRLPSLAEAVAGREAALADSLARLGPGWDADRVAGFSASVTIRERIRHHDALLQDSEAEARAARQRAMEAERLARERGPDLDTLQKAIADLPPPAGGIPALEERERAFASWDRLARSRDLLRQEESHAQDRLADARNEAAQAMTERAVIEARSGLPWWAPALAAAIFTLVAIIFAARQDFPAAAGIGVLGGVAAGLVLWWRSVAMRDRSARLHVLVERVRAAGARATALRARIEEVVDARRRVETEAVRASQILVGREDAPDEEVIRAGDSLADERRVEDRRVALSEQARAAEEAARRARQELEAATEARQAAERALEGTRAGWRRVLQEVGLAQDLTPDGAMEVLRAAEVARDRHRELTQAITSQRTADEAVQRFVEACNRLLRACRREPTDGEGVPAAFDVLRSDLTRAEEAGHEKRRLHEQIEELDGEVQTYQEELRRVQEERRNLLLQGGTQDPEEFRRRAEQYREQSALRGERQQLEVAMRLRTGGPEQLRELEDALTGTTLDRLQGERDEVTAGVERLEAELRNLQDQKGRLEERLGHLEQGEELAANLLELQSLRGQLEEEARRWAVRILCLALLDEAQAIYERQRQPGVLRRASEFFAAMTGGRYVRVIAPAGERRLEVEREDGRRLRAERPPLSTGTAEQIYLAMRLALAREYAAHAAPLPLVLDDTLANFDDHRALHTARVLTEIAQDHQVLLFTCHRHIGALFRDNGLPANTVTLPAVA